MSRLPEYRQIEKKDLESFKKLILPDIYEELNDQEEIDTDYIAISSWMNDEPAGAIIIDPEGSGDLNAFLLPLSAALCSGRPAFRNSNAQVLLKLFESISLLFLKFR